MRKLLCPQCKVSSMYVKNGKGERRAVYVTDGGEIVARKEGETLDGFDPVSYTHLSRMQSGLTW